MIEAELDEGNNIQINGLKQEIKEHNEPEQLIENAFAKQGKCSSKIYFLFEFLF